MDQTKLSETELLARDAKRDLAAELKESLAQLKVSEVGRVWVNDGKGNCKSRPSRKRASR